MIQRPRFRTCFRIEQIANEGVLVLTETDYRLLKGHVERLAPLMNGVRTTDEIVHILEGEAPARDLYITLQELERRGYITNGTGPHPTMDAAYWDGLGVEVSEAADRLDALVVGVSAFGAVQAGPMVAALRALGIRVGADADLDVVISDDYLSQGMPMYNEEALRRSRPFLLVKPTGRVIWIGPLVVPGQTGCWECLAHRLRLNRPAETFLRQRNGAASSFSLPASGLASTIQTGLQIAATEIAKWIAQGKSEVLEGTLVTFDTRTLETRMHKLVRRPQCPCCGAEVGTGDRLPHPLNLKNRKKHVVDDGGHRIVPPEVTLRTYDHHISPITGIVSRLRRISDHGNQLVHSYAAGHNVASRYDGIGLIYKNLRDISGGKGRTDVQARVSALSEAVERSSGIYQGDGQSRVASYQELMEAAIHPNDCMRFSEQQYENRETLNEGDDRLAHWVPERFDVTREVEWTPIWSVSQHTFKYLPTAYCYYGYPRENSSFCRADSNGNAAGNCLEEAIMQGFMELIERDGVALWWYNRLLMPGVDLQSFEEPYFQDVCSYYESIDRELWVLDLTTDLKIPTFVAVSRRINAARQDILFGFGAHFDPRLGIMRAITELNQVLPTALGIKEDAEGMPIHPDKRAIEWWIQATVDNQSYLLPTTDMRPREVQDFVVRQNDDLLADIRTAARIVEEKGMELLVLDQTRPDIGMPVVKVVVPGLRHYWPRFGPGRLYDVPVQEGWLKESTSEARLNPFIIFF
jgi:ribosomal protein S12 methylthiotransferase accessory factor